MAGQENANMPVRQEAPAKLGPPYASEVFSFTIDDHGTAAGSTSWAREGTLPIA